MQNDLSINVKNQISGTLNLLRSRPPSHHSAVLADRGRKVALGAGIAVIVIGGLVMFGWLMHSAALTTILDEGVSMKPLTAICFIIGGIGLTAYALTIPEGLADGWKLRLSQACGGCIALVGSFTLIEYASGFDYGVDELFFHEQLLASNVLYPGRMAMATAGGFLFLGLALMLLNSPSGPIAMLTQFLALLVLGLGLIAIQGYMFEVKHLYQISAFSSVAIHTALGFILFALGILLVQVTRGWMAIVASVHLGGLLVRNLLPLILTLPLLLAWVRWKGEKAGLYGTGFGLALFTTTNMIVLGLVIWRNAHQLNVIDQQRSDAELKNQQIIHSLPQLVWTCEPGGQCDFLSQQWVDYTGIAAADQLGTGWLKRIHPDDQERLMTAWNSAVAQGSDFHLEFRICRYDNVYRWFDTRAIAWRNRAGEIVKWFGSNTDIHDQYKMRERLHTNDFRLSGIINSAMDAIITVDEAQHIQIFNAAAEKMFGYSAAEILGKPLDCLIPHRFRALHRAHIRDFGETNVTRRTMGELNAIYGLRASGEEFPIEASISQIGTSGGKLFTVILRDITERKRTEQILLESEAKIAGIVDSAMDAIITVDGQQKIILFNRAAENMFACTAEDALGLPIEHFIPERFRAAHHHHVTGFGETQVMTRTMAGARAISGLRTDGTEFPIEASISQIDIAGQKLYTVILRDISERKKAEETLRLQASLFDQSYDGVFVWKWGGEIFFWNRGAEKLYGFSREEALGTLSHQLLQTRTAVGLDRVLSILEEENYWEGELVHTTKDGRVITVDSRLVLVRENDMTYVLETIRDITERKRTEAALRESEALFSTIFRVSPVSISISHLSNGQYVTVNDAFLNRYGLTREAVIGHTSEELGLWVSATDRCQFMDQLQAAGRAHNFETQYRTKTGEIGNVLVSAEIIEQAGGKYLLSIGYDITERKRAEEVVSRNRAQLEAVFQAIQDGIVVTDMQGNFLLVNEAEARTTGFASTEVMKANLGAFRDLFELRYPNGQLLPFEDWPLNKILHGQSIKHWELLVRRLDIGREWYFSYSGVPVYNEHGEQILCVISTSDITERKQAEEEVHRLNVELEERVVQRTRQLEAANKELEAFSYSVSHDLRSPLRTIDGFSQAVLEDFSTQLPAEGQRYLHTIREGAQRMGNLIDDLLSFSRLSRQPINKKPVNTAQLVREVLNELQADQQNRDLDLQVGELLTCWGDAVLLKQVWVNLISNALKYSRGQHPAIIEIGCKVAGNEKVYFVRDNGTGFDMQYAHKLFGVFQRLHRAEDFEGTGVGLAIVQRVIHRHGGRVWAEAAVDKGATFYFTIEGEAS